MIELLKAFSALAMLSSALLTLLGEGSLRKTAALVFGLLLMLCWAEGLLSLTVPADPTTAETAALQRTGLTLTQAEANALQFLTPEVTPSP